MPPWRRSLTACSTTTCGPVNRSRRRTGSRTTRCAASPNSSATCLDGLRRPGALLCVSLLRRRAGAHPDDDYAPRQRLERRLGRDQPRFEPLRTGGVSHVHQSERDPDGRAEYGPAARTRPWTGRGRAPAESIRKVTQSKCACRCSRSVSAVATMSAWACCSSGATVGSVSRGHGRKCARGSGSSSRTCRRSSRSSRSRVCSR
jgi:hypothetical protein